MEYIKQLTDEELKKTYRALDVSIYTLECYSVTDISIQQQVTEELLRRGYDFDIEVKIRKVRVGEGATN